MKRGINYSRVMGNPGEFDGDPLISAPEETITTNARNMNGVRAKVLELKKYRNKIQKYTEYPTGRFNNRQLKEIWLGLDRGVDISKYAYPWVNYNQMRIVRKALSRGIDISEYLYYGLSNDTLAHIELWMKDKLDIKPYIYLGFDGDQFNVLRDCLLAEIPTSIFQPYFTGKEMIAIYRIMCAISKYQWADNVISSLIANRHVDGLLNLFLRKVLRWGYRNDDIPEDYDDNIELAAWLLINEYTRILQCALKFDIDLNDAKTFCMTYRGSNVDIVQNFYIRAMSSSHGVRIKNIDNGRKELEEKWKALNVEIEFLPGVRRLVLDDFDPFLGKSSMLNTSESMNMKSVDSE